MLLGVPRYPSCIPTETPSTYSAPKSRAARVGTGATSPPSTRQRVPISTGSNKPGNAQLARIASIRLPCVITTGSPLFKSVATTAMGMCKSSNCRASKTRSIRSRSRCGYATPGDNTPPSAGPFPGRGRGVRCPKGPFGGSCFTPREAQRPQNPPMGRASRKNSTDVLRRRQRTKSGNSLDSTFLLRTCPLCTIGLRSTTRDSLLRQDAPIGGGMHSAFARWIGQPVILQVALGDIKVPLRGKLLKEGGDTLRMRIGDGWDVDIYKTMVMAVEEDAMATDVD